jgi:hypothetical protein
VDTLESITLSNQLTHIKSYAFYGAESITSYVLPESLTTIGDFAFGKNTALTEIMIPSQVTHIGYYVFFGITNMVIKLNHETVPSSFTSGWNQGDLVVELHIIP